MESVIKYTYCVTVRKTLIHCYKTYRRGLLRTSEVINTIWIWSFKFHNYWFYIYLYAYSCFLCLILGILSVAVMPFFLIIVIKQSTIMWVFIEYKFKKIKDDHLKILSWDLELQICFHKVSTVFTLSYVMLLYFKLFKSSSGTQ